MVIPKGRSVIGGVLIPGLIRSRSSEAASRFVEYLSTIFRYQVLLGSRVLRLTVVYYTVSVSGSF